MKPTIKKFVPAKKASGASAGTVPQDPQSPHPRVPEMRWCDYGTAVYHAKCYGFPYKTDADVLSMHKRLKYANPENYQPLPPTPSNYERAVEQMAVIRGFAKSGNSSTAPVPPAGEFVESTPPTSSSGPVTVQKFVPKQKGPGVIDTIVKVLKEEASKAKPMTKDRLLKRLVKLIPGRDADKMASTIRAQLANSGLKAKGVPIRCDGNGGYWIRKG